MTKTFSIYLEILIVFSSQNNIYLLLYSHQSKRNISKYWILKESLILSYLAILLLLNSLLNFNFLILHAMQVANTLVPPLVSYKTVEFLNLVSFYIVSYIWYFILSIKPGYFNISTISSFLNISLFWLSHLLQKLEMTVIFQLYKTLMLLSLVCFSYLLQQIFSVLVAINTILLSFFLASILKTYFQIFFGIFFSVLPVTCFILYYIFKSSFF